MILSCVFLCGGFRGAAQTNQIQTIPLYTGWNLISFQVNPAGFAPADITNALGSDCGTLLAIWGYSASNKTWQVWQTNSLPPAVASLSRLMPGSGYWLKVSKGTVLQLTGGAWNGTTSLSPGWNLVGFPGLIVGSAGKTDFQSIFRGSLSSVPIIWSYLAGASQQYSGYDSLAYPPITSLTGIQPGVGYWVYSLGNLNFTPTPQIALAADSDASPLQAQEYFTTGDPRYLGTNSALYQNLIVRFAGPEDAAFDLNHNGILDDPYTQDTIFFQSGLNQQNFTIANSGSGLMNWWIESYVPWLTANPSAGSTTTGLDPVQLTVDRSGLLPGYYTNTFIIHAGSVDKTVTAILQVPTVAGDYHGYASIKTVNGKAISLGAVDLNLSLFMESTSTGETHFRGVIDREKALLFPVDVFMNGVFYQGLNFSATTSFPMDPVDHNAPPYTSFGSASLSGNNTNVAQNPVYTVSQVGSQTMLNDLNVNGNGVMDVQNIFPFGIRREVTLLGSRTTSDHLDGTYIEAILGVLPNSQRIYMTGTFTLDRDTLAPTTTSIYNGQTSATVVIGGSSTTVYTNTLTVGAGVQIQGANINLNINYPDYTQIDVRLYGPHGQFYDFGTNVAGLTSFNLTNFNNTFGNGSWNLVVNWNPASGQHGYFNGWGLQLSGLAYYSVTGAVMTASGPTNVAVSGANVVLVGSNILPQSNTATNGGFTFGSLTENEYTLTVSALGYYPTNVSFNVDATNVSLGQIVLTPITVPSPTITAAPFIGQAPLYVTYTPLIPTATATALGSNVVATWNFGDGTTMLATQTVSVAHFYTNGGSYLAKVTFSGSSGSLNLTNGYITALAAQPNLARVTNSYYVFGGVYVGSLASPNATNNVLEPGSVTTTNWQATLGTNSITVYGANGYLHQESKRDSADFDIDRFPFTTPNQQLGPEDTDFFTQIGTVFDSQYHIVQTGLLNTNVIAPYRMICTMGGYVFPYETVPWSDQTAQVGTFTLQALCVVQ